MTIYYAIIETVNTVNRLANLTQELATKKAYSINATTRTATELAGTVYWTNLFTGCYLVSVSDDTDGLTVVFQLLVHEDDQSAFADCAALHMREIPASIAALPTVAQIWAGVTDAFKTAIATAVWAFTGGRTVTNSGVIQLVSRVSADGLSCTINPGENYSATYENQLSFDLTGFPDLTDQTIEFKGTQMGDLSMTVTNGGEEVQTVYMEPDETETAEITLEDQKGYIWWDEAKKIISFVQINHGIKVS